LKHGSRVQKARQLLLSTNLFESHQKIFSKHVKKAFHLLISTLIVQRRRAPIVPVPVYKSITNTAAQDQPPSWKWTGTDDATPVEDDSTQLLDTQAGGLRSMITWVLSRMPWVPPVMGTEVVYNYVDRKDEIKWNVGGTAVDDDSAAITNEMVPGLQGLIA
jgi:hypothetical protein